MRHALLATASLLVLCISSAGHAASADDAAFNKFDKPVYDSSGKCVRTLWQEESDPCAPAAPAPAPAPAPVVQAPAPAPVPVVALEQRTIYFEFNKANLELEAQAKLDQLAIIINKSSAIADVVIHGFTDQIGTDSYNEALATKRTLAVKEYLDTKTTTKISQGDIRGLGKSKPEEQCKAIKKRTERISCMNKERRVEIEFKATE